MLPNSVKSSFWGICCESGKKYSQVVTTTFHISMAALDPTVIPTSPCVSLMMERSGSQYLLCTLNPKSILQSNLDLYFEKGENVIFFLKGVGSVHLSGYYVYDKSDIKHKENTFSVKNITEVTPTKQSQLQKKKTAAKEEDSDDESSDDESSDEVEIKEKAKIEKKNVSNPFEQMTSLLKKKKLAAEEEEDSDDEDSSEESEKGFTSAKKSPASPSANAISGKIRAGKVTVDVESSDEDSDTDSDVKETKTAKSPQLPAKKRPAEDDSDDDSDDLSETSSEENNEKVSAPKEKKKAKMETSTPVLGNKLAVTPQKKVTLVNLASDGKNKKKYPGDMDTSIGRTPMPKKTMSFLQGLKSVESPKQLASPNEKNASMNQSIQNQSSNQLNSSTDLTSSTKKKKKKRKSKAGVAESNLDDSMHVKGSDNFSGPKYSKKLQGGIEYDDIRVGHGPPAVKGKMVHVHYVGKLDNNKVFDSCQTGSKPFSFKLGSGQVIKGWDLGVEGMKVGGKRRLKLPASMGYGKEKTGPIPPNSTLHFTVELKAVS